MHRLRVWTASLLSRVDWMVSQIENHEAVARSAIEDVRQAAARAKVQLARVRQDGEALRKRVAEQREEEAVWRERARRCAPEDEERALECLRRSNRAARRVAELSPRCDEHERIEKQLATDVASIDDRLLRLNEQQNVLRTRQSRAEALSRVRETGGSLASEIDDILERWEIRIVEREIAGGCAPGVADPSADRFEDAFVNEEERAALRAQLAELRACD
jgi:phage shock protein A